VADGSVKPAQAGFVVERSEAVQARFQPPASPSPRGHTTRTDRVIDQSSIY